MSYPRTLLLCFCLSVPALATQGALTIPEWDAAALEPGSSHGTSPNAEQMFRKAEGALARGHIGEAEQCYREITRIDPNDWETHERLVLLYQWQGDREKRDRELHALREMYRKGIHWRDYIVRDQFILKEWRLLAAEVLSREGSGDRRFLFSVHDAATGRFLHLVSMKRRAESQWVPSTADPFHPEKREGYRFTLRCEGRTKRFFLVSGPSLDLETRNMLASFLESI